MDDSALVRVADGPADRREEAQPVAQLRGRGSVTAHVVAHVVVERLAGDQLHREEVLAVLGAAGLVDGGDVGVNEARERLRLTSEETQPQLIAVAASSDDLESNAAAGRLLLGFVDDPHPAAAEHRKDAEAADLVRQRNVGWALHGARERERRDLGFVGHGEESGPIVSCGSCSSRGPVRRSRDGSRREGGAWPPPSWRCTPSSPAAE